MRSSARNSVAVERRPADLEMDVLALERNSLNFFEYVPMDFSGDNH